MINKTKYISDHVYESTNENGDSIKIDMRPLDEKQGLSPMELVLSAVAGCAAVDIVSMLKKKRKRLKTFMSKLRAGGMTTTRKNLIKFTPGTF